MKTIKGIDESMSSFDDELPKDTVLPTYRKLFKSTVGLAAARSGEEALDMYQLGLKLKIEGADIALEDAEFKLLRGCVEKNAGQLISHYLAQLLMKLKESEK